MDFLKIWFIQILPEPLHYQQIWKVKQVMFYICEIFFLYYKKRVLIFFFFFLTAPKAKRCL